MANFPDIPPTAFSEMREDNAIRDTSEYGYVHTRRKYTRCRRRYKYEYRNIPESDANTIMNFYDIVGTYDAFYLTLPKNGGTIRARFLRSPTRTYVSPTISNVTDIEFEEV